MDTQELTNEELFVFYVEQGISKSEAYRRIFDCSKLKDNTIHMYAWKYSNSTSVTALAGTIEDNLFTRYAKARLDAFDRLIKLSNKSDSDFVQMESANKILSLTAKAKKLELDVNHSSDELKNVLDELREIALNPITPQRDSHEGKKVSYNIFRDSEKASESNLNHLDFDVCNGIQNLDGTWSYVINTGFSDVTVLEKKYDSLTIDGEVATTELLEEQVSGINPLSPNKVVMGNDTGTTGRFRDNDTGLFVSNDKAKEIIDESTV